MNVKKCTVCNIKIDEDNYKKKVEIYVKTVTIIIKKYITMTKRKEKLMNL